MVGTPCRVAVTMHLTTCQERRNITDAFLRAAVPMRSVTSEGFVAARDILVTFECGMEGDVASLPLLVTLGMINVGTEERDAFISENTVTISCCTANRELVVTVMRDDIVGKIAV